MVRCHFMTATSAEDSPVPTSTSVVANDGLLIRKMHGV